LFPSKSARTLTHLIFAKNVRNNYGASYIRTAVRARILRRSINLCIIQATVVMREVASRESDDRVMFAWSHGESIIENYHACNAFRRERSREKEKDCGLAFSRFTADISSRLRGSASVVVVVRGRTAAENESGQSTAATPTRSSP